MDHEILKSQLLGKLLLSKKAVLPKHLENALVEQLDSGQPLGRILLAHNWVKSEILLQTLSEQSKHASIDLETTQPTQRALDAVDRWLAWECIALPLELLDTDPPVISVALAPPVRPHVVKRIEHKTDCRVQVFLAPESRIREALERHYPREIVLDGIESDHTAENEFVVFEGGEVRRIHLDRRSSLGSDLDSSL